MIELIHNQFLPICNQDINVVCSGGMDSSLLLYLLMNNHKNKITVFTCGNKQKHYRSTKIVPDVIDYCLNKTGFDLSNLQHRIFYVTEQTSQTLFDPVNQMGGGNPTYTGITADPTWGVEFSSPRSQTHMRDPRVQRSIYKDNYILPFTNLNKKHIAELYRTHNIMDLIPLTNSCERRDNSLEHCGKCWWCEERRWGLES